MAPSLAHHTPDQSTAPTANHRGGRGGCAAGARHDPTHETHGEAPGPHPSPAPPATDPAVERGSPEGWRRDPPSSNCPAAPTHRGGHATGHSPAASPPRVERRTAGQAGRRTRYGLASPSAAQPPHSR